MPKRILSLVILLASAAWAHTAALDGKKVFYEAAGNGKDTLVLIHGWTCDQTLWDAQITTFAARYRVLAVDLPGHGRSDAAVDYSMERMARAVEAVMRKERVEHATLVGHSMAGAVILNFARLFPAKLDRAVLVDTMFLDAEAVPKMAGFVTSFEGPEAAANREKMVQGMFTDATTPAMREKIRKVMLGTPAPVAAGAMKGMFSAEAWQFTPHNAPALLLVAPKTTTIREEAVKLRFPNLTFQRMETGGHFFQIETPDVFNKIVLGWLASH